MNTRVLCLKVGCAFSIAFGLVIALGAVPALQWPTSAMIDFVVYPFDGNQSVQALEARLLSAICGGLLVGFGVLIWSVTTEVYVKDEQTGRKLILRSIIAWFIVDSSMSVAAGAPLNVIGNIGFLLIFVLPVWQSTQPQSHASEDFR